MADYRQILINSTDTLNNSSKTINEMKQVVYNIEGDGIKASQELIKQRESIQKNIEKTDDLEEKISNANHLLRIMTRRRIITSLICLSIIIILIVLIVIIIIIEIFSKSSNGSGGSGNIEN